MPRGVHRRNTVNEGAITVIPAATFTALPWFTKALNQDEQNTVVATSQQLAASLEKFGKSRLEIGQHLTKLQSVLEPHNLFQKYLKHFHFSKRTAYRYIAKFKNAQALPESILNEALLRGMDIGGETELKPFGVYTEAVRKLPPPAAPTKEQAVTYLAQLDNVRKETPADTSTGAGPILQAVDPQIALREVISVFRSRYNRLPNNARTRSAWVRSVVGMVLTVAGINAPQSVTPIVVPEDFIAKRGRPATAAA